jgi:hypothetical protein
MKIRTRQPDHRAPPVTKVSGGKIEVSCRARIDLLVPGWPLQAENEPNDGYLLRQCGVRNGQSYGALPSTPKNAC